MPYRDLPAFMQSLNQRNSDSARALEFTILTAVRTSDTIGMTDTELDLKAKTWTIPAARIKGKKGARKRDHVVPLCDRAIEILEAMPRTKGRPFALSNMAMLNFLQGIKACEDFTVHGFRSTFKDWCSEHTEYPNEVSEMALAHTVSDKVEAAYRRGDMRDRRRRLMEDWESYCKGLPAKADNVIQFGGRA
jgi:integrase